MRPSGSSLRSALPLLAALLVTWAASAVSAEPPVVVDVSPDGQLVVRPAESPPAPGRLLYRADVPFPAAPDWQGDLERAVGGLAFGDIDGDEDLDLACGCYDASNAFPPITVYRTLVYRNDGGTLETTPSWTSTDERHTGKVRFGDEDGDGRPDLFCANGGQSLQPSVIYRNGPGGMDTTPDWICADQTWSLSGAFGDVDGDGDMDLVVANQGNTIIPTRPVHLFRNDGGALTTTPVWASADSALTNAVALDDLDGSSLVAITDHVVPAIEGEQKIFRLPHQSVHSIDRVEVMGVTGEYPWTSDRLAGRVHFASPPPSGTQVRIDYTVATLPDAAFSRWAASATCVYSNVGGTFGATPSWTTGDPGATDKGIGFSDVDGDGDADLVHGSSGDPTQLWRNDGGTLVGPVWASDNTYHGTQDLAWGDVDADGDEDLATIEFGNGHVRVYLNREGTLDEVPSWFYDLASSGTAIAWGDVDGDGFLDLAAGSAREPIVVFLNQLVPVGAPDVAAPADAGARMRLVAAPSPAAGAMSIRLAAGDGSRATGRVAGPIQVIDAGGRVVREIAVPEAAGGGASVAWDTRDTDGRPVAAGIYFLRTETDGGPVFGRAVVVR